MRTHASGAGERAARDAGPDAVTELLGARLRSTTTGADAATEVRKRSANLMTWCERCATGIYIRCANDHAIGNDGDDCTGAYRAKEIAARSLLCLDCWRTTDPTSMKAMKARG